MKESKRVFNVPYKRMTVNSMGNKSIRIIQTILSFISLPLSVLGGTRAMNDILNMDLLNTRIIFSVVIGVMFMIIVIGTFDNFIKILNIWLDHKNIDLFLIDLEDSFSIGSLPSDMYICFTDIDGIVIGYLNDSKYIKEYINSDEIRFYMFLKVYEKCNVNMKEEFGGFSNE